MTMMMLLVNTDVFRGGDDDFDDDDKDDGRGGSGSGSEKNPVYNLWFIRYIPG